MIFKNLTIGIKDLRINNYCTQIYSSHIFQNLDYSIKFRQFILFKNILNRNSYLLK